MLELVNEEAPKIEGGHQPGRESQVGQRPASSQTKASCRRSGCSRQEAPGVARHRISDRVGSERRHSGIRPTSARKACVSLGPRRPVSAERRLRLPTHLTEIPQTAVLEADYAPLRCGRQVSRAGFGFEAMQNRSFRLAPRVRAGFVATFVVMDAPCPLRCCRSWLSGLMPGAVAALV
jgi:hypothetical protein